MGRARRCLELLWPVFPHPKLPVSPLAVPAGKDKAGANSPGAFPRAKLPAAHAEGKAAILLQEGNHLFLRARFEEALACYQSAAADESMRVETSWYSALCMQNLGRWEQARKHYLSALALDASLFDAKVGLALRQLHCGHPHTAFRELRHHLRTKPDSYMALFGAAVALQLMDRRQEALALCRHILALYDDETMSGELVRLTS